MDSKQIAEAMRLKLPVRHNGITYQQITEYILWYDAAAPGAPLSPSSIRTATASPERRPTVSSWSLRKEEP